MTLEAARLAAAPTLTGEDTPPNGGITAYARRVFGEALRQAAADPSHVIGVDDLLRAALRDSRGRRGADAGGAQCDRGDVLGRIG